ncbi:MAG: hypothetical protein WCS69_13890 [Ignavibacteriaceae bacterium]
MEDSQVTMHSDGRVNKHKRPVLIVSSKIYLTNKNYPFIHAIPLSTQTQLDKFIFPIERSYIDIVENFQPDKDSCAIIPLYQPLELKYIKDRCGKIDETCFHAIFYILVNEVIGYENYDLDID